MTTIAVFTATEGRCLRVVSTNAPAPSQADVGEIQVTLEDESINAFYTYYDFDTASVVSMPPRPSEFYLFDYTQKIWVFDSVGAWSAIRAQRNRLFTSCDWTQLPDVPAATSKLWGPYRQQLRDITEQKDPENILWPTPPVE